MGLGERVCGRGLAARGGMEGLVDKGLALRGGTGGAFRSRHSSLTWHGKEHRGLDRWAVPGSSTRGPTAPGKRRWYQQDLRTGEETEQARVRDTEDARGRSQASPILPGTDAAAEILQVMEVQQAKG